MSIKDKIYQALKSVETHSYYADTTYNRFPRIVFYLVSNVPRRYSGNRLTNRVTYQVSYFSNDGLNVENNPILWEIIDKLEAQNLSTTNWSETVNVDEKENVAVYHYYMEVSGLA